MLGAGICKHRSCDQGYITVKECGCDATEQVLEFSESCFRKYCSRNPQRSSMVSGELGASMRQRFQPSGVRETTSHSMDSARRRLAWMVVVCV